MDRFSKFLSLPNLLVLATSLTTIHAAPGPCPSDSSTEGYTDLNTFNQDTSSGPDGQTYILCPGTTFVTTCDDDDLFIGRPNTKVQCGADGSSRNGCIMTREPGNTQMCPFVLTPEGVTGITLQGITFQGTPGEEPLKRGTVCITGNEVTLEDCHWKNLHMATPPLVGMAVPLVKAIGGKLTINNCSFQGNAGGWLVQANEAEQLTITNTYARCNEMVGELVHANLPEGTLSMEKSCFVDNVYNGATAKSSDPRATVQAAEGTLFENGSSKQNAAGPGIECVGVQHDVDCFPFAADACSVAVDNDATTRACPAPKLTSAPTTDAATSPPSSASKFLPRIAKTAVSTPLVICAVLAML